MPARLSPPVLFIWPLLAAGCEGTPAPAPTGEMAEPAAEPEDDRSDAPAGRSAPEAPPQARALPMLPPGPIAAPADVARPPAEGERTRSNVVSKVLVPGKGSRRPDASGVVQVSYTGWTTDGRMFDTSRYAGQPATLALPRAIPGLAEALSLMVEGEQRRLWIPGSLAHQGRPGRPQGMLVYDVELLKVLP